MMNQSDFLKNISEFNSLPLVVMAGVELISSKDLWLLVRKLKPHKRHNTLKVQMDRYHGHGLIKKPVKHWCNQSRLETYYIRPQDAKYVYVMEHDKLRRHIIDEWNINQ